MLNTRQTGLVRKHRGSIGISGTIIHVRQFGISIKRRAMVIVSCDGYLFRCVGLSEEKLASKFSVDNFGQIHFWSVI